MLPATLITFTTFLFKLCSASPIYNLQPAFITNTVGATTGRNIRHLPCISRRNSNQNGFCMFAIDCLKANGTHLGTCIDGFYFGSCCYLEPVNEIIDNTIDTDIIPHREPPSRVSSTTSKTSTLGPPTYKLTTLNIKINSTTTSTERTTTIKNITNTLTTANPIIKETSLTLGTTSSNSTNDIKSQTIQSLGNNTLNEVSTKISTISIINRTEEVTKNPVTKVPVSVWTSKTPTVSSLSTTASKIIPTKHTSSTLPEINSNTTEKFHLVTFTESTVNAVSTKKPTKVTPTKRTSKPTKPTKPTKPSSNPSSVTIFKRPEITTTKSRTTVKPTKKISSLSKPTKKITTTSKLTTSKPPLKITTFTTTTQISTNQTSALSVTEKVNSSVSSLSHSSTTVSSSNSPTTVSTVTTSTPNTLLSSKNKTDDVGYNKNVTTSAPDFGLFNDTTKDWVPITTPDGWVLVSGIGSNLNQSMVENLTPSSSQMSSQSSSALFTNAMPTRSTMTTSTQVLPVDVPSVTVAVDVMIASSNSTNTSTEYEVSSVSTTTSMESLSLNPVIQPIEQTDNMSHYTNICGRRTYPEARIVGGEKSSFGKWPWQISLRQWRTSTYLHKCGAALLNENWAITAAHCVDNVPPSDLLLRLGEYDLSNESEPYLHQERRVQIVASHPQFDPRTFEYDLALLRFYEPVNFQPNIIPICVPQNDENFVGRIAYVTGWGRLYEDGPLPSILQEVSVPVINNTVCESMYRAAGYIEHIPHIFICAGWRRGGFDSCEGDSGGPMVIQRSDKRFLLAGVISWGIGCAEPNQPGVYTRISEFRDWINQILQF